MEISPEYFVQAFIDFVESENFQQKFEGYFKLKHAPIDTADRTLEDYVGYLDFETMVNEELERLRIQLGLTNSTFIDLCRRACSVDARAEQYIKLLLNTTHYETYESVTNTVAEQYCGMKRPTNKEFQTRLDQLQTQPWIHHRRPCRKVKVLLMGDGRQGKTALINAFMGVPFFDTASTVGISETVCAVRNTHLNPTGQWFYSAKPERFLEAELAKMLLSDDRIEPPLTSSSAISSSSNVSSNLVVHCTDVFSRYQVDDPVMVQSLKTGQWKLATVVRIHHPSTVNTASTPSGASSLPSTILMTVDVIYTLDNKKECKVALERVMPDTISSESAATATSTTTTTSDSATLDTSRSESSATTSSSIAPTSTHYSFDPDLVMKILDDDADQQQPTAGPPLTSSLMLTLLDLGGQSVFTVIHQFFLTANGIYLLVFNMESILSDGERRQEALDHLASCLNSIVVHAAPRGGHASTTPVVFVGTHKDKVRLIDQHVYISNLLYTNFARNPAWASVIECTIMHRGGQQPQSQLPLPLWFYPVDNVAGREGDETIRQLMKGIETAAVQVSTHEARPLLSWFKALDRLRDNGQTCLSYADVSALATSCGVAEHFSENHDSRSNSNNDTDLPSMLSFFHETGELMWAKDDKSLRNVIILDPVKFFVGPAAMVIRKYHADGIVGVDIDCINSDLIVHFGERHIECIKRENLRWRHLVERGIVDHKILSILWRDHTAQMTSCASCDGIVILAHLMVRCGLFVPLRHGLHPQSSATAALAPSKQYLIPALMRPASREMLHEADWTDGPVNTCFLVFTANPEFSSATTITLGDLKAEGFLPNGLFETLLGHAVAWSQQTSLVLTNLSERQCLFRNMAKLSFGNQRFRLALLSQWNCVVVDVEGSNPLPVQKRLTELLCRIIAHRMKQLICFVALPYSAVATVPAANLKENIDAVLPPDLLLVPIKEVEKVLRNESILNRRGEGRALLTAQHARARFGAWFPELNAARLPMVQSPSYDVFISYRWGDNDSDFTEALFEALSVFSVGPSNRAVRVFRDTKRLQAGLDFQEGFSQALMCSNVICPVFSCEALQRLTTSSFNPDREDNLLCEFMLAIVCYHENAHGLSQSSGTDNHVQRLFPIMMGLRENGVAGSKHPIGSLFASGILDRLSDAYPTATLMKLKSLLTTHGRSRQLLRQSEMLDHWTVKDIVLKISKFLSFSAWSVPFEALVMDSASAIVDVVEACCVDEREPSSVAPTLPSQLEPLSMSSTGASMNRSPSALKLSVPKVTAVDPLGQKQQSPSPAVISLEELSIENVVSMFVRMNLTSCTETIRNEEIDGATLNCVQNEEELKTDLKLELPHVKLRKLFGFISKFSTNGVPVSLIQP